ncbi:MAG TPA: 2-oxoacid:acceptor oxidoreductase family protein [Spirochaetota bacterium]|nr:2-oxoacid:acceptor oxidoreductase family protein [Spirochaetota bacterium]
MNERIIIAGAGGQGIMSLGIILTEAGMHSGLHVSHFPSYGAEMRGGTANCAVCISDKPIAAPVVSRPSSLIIFNQPSMTKFKSTLKSSGRLLYNASLIKEEPAADNCRVTAVKANEEAVECGSIKGANMILLGTFLNILQNRITLSETEKALGHRFHHKNKSVIDFNMKCIRRGMELAADR